FRDGYYHILASYDDGEVSRFGPGAAHLRELLRYAIARGLKRFDFTIGDEPYKRDWCESEQRLHDYSAAVTWRGWPSAVVSGSWRRMKRAIKQSAPLWNAVVRMRSALVQARLTYVFSHAYLLSHDPAYREAARHGLAFLMRASRAPDGGWFRAVSVDGATLDNTRDAYDHAFVLFALAWYFRATGDASAIQLAD